MELFNYQQQIFNNIKDKNSIALFMEPGTGKTIMSLTKFNYDYNESKTNKLLIICLASKVQEWYEDCISILNDNYSPVILNKGTNKNKELLLNDTNIKIISFQSLLNVSVETLKILNNKWTIIIDESQVIKNHKSKISKLCHILGEKTQNKMILTGTPQNKGYIDYFSQYKFLGIFSKLKDFQDRFCILERARFGGPYTMEITGYKNIDILDKIIFNSAVYYKREYSPHEVPSQKYINFNKPKIYKSFMRDRVYEDVICPNAGVLRMRLRQICGGALNQYRFENEKEEWIKDFIENNESRIVIFHNFDEEWHILEEIVKKLKRPLSIYNGKVKDTKNFIEKDNTVLIVNYASGGTGINWLKIANIGIFYTPPESYMVFEQARKRIDRVGQVTNPMFYCLRTIDSVEKKIYETIEAKEDFDDKKFKQYLESEGIENV